MRFWALPKDSNWAAVVNNWTCPRFFPVFMSGSIEAKGFPLYWAGTGSKEGAIASGAFNGITGFSNRGIIRKAYHAICKQFCAKKKCEDLQINLVGWSRGAIGAVEVADWLNYYGCTCEVPKCCDDKDSGSVTKTFQPVEVNFLGLFDPVSMHLIDEAMKYTVYAPFAFYFESEIPSNVKFTASVRRTKLGGDESIYPRMPYTGVNATADYWPSGQKSTQAQVGRDDVPYQWMKKKAIANGVEFK